MSEIEKLEQEISGAIAAASDEAGLETARIGALGKSGSVSALLKTLGGMTPEQRKEQGPLINGLKDRVTAAIAARREALKGAALDARLNTETVDVTLPVRESPAEAGRIHPVSQVLEELTAIFADMGFAVAEGPDIETDDFNFTKLNFPPGHPAREMQDTFYLNPKPDGSRMVLRTHTSPVQIRTMLGQKPPIRVIIPGRTYRSDWDQTHTPMFHQVEGLVIDKGSHLGHLKWILREFCKAFFEVDDVKMRFRPSFFPFTEPSLEVDIQCRRTKDEVRFGEGEDWMEILGCGMVHPNVLRNCGLDPDEYQGFAWGMGIDRIAMLKYGISDLRQLFEADVRWISHYGFRPLDFPTLGGRAEHMNAVEIPAHYRGLPRFSFGDNPTLADELLALVLAGHKTATCTTPDDPNMSRPGERWIVLDGRRRGTLRDRNGRDHQPTIRPSRRAVRVRRRGRRPQPRLLARRTPRLFRAPRQVSRRNDARVRAVSLA